MKKIILVAVLFFATVGSALAEKSVPEGVDHGYTQSTFSNSDPSVVIIKRLRKLSTDINGAKDKKGVRIGGLRQEVAGVRSLVVFGDSVAVVTNGYAADAANNARIGANNSFLSAKNTSRGGYLDKAIASIVENVWLVCILGLLAMAILGWLVRRWVRNARDHVVNTVNTLNSSVTTAMNSVIANANENMSSIRADIANVPVITTLGRPFVLKDVGGSGKNVRITPVFIDGCYRTLSLPKDHPAVEYHNSGDIPRMPLGSVRVTDMKSAYDRILKQDKRFGGSGFANQLQQRIVDHAFETGEVEEVEQSQPL